MNIDVSLDTWKDIISNPAAYNFEYQGTSIPSIIDEKYQVRYTGRKGQDNIDQAFNFYQHVRDQAKLSERKNPRILDFGAGWGRVIRFFLRETKAENLFAMDVMKEAVDFMHETKFEGNIIKCNELPPVSTKLENIDVIYALSVFSHLHESHFEAWMKYFKTILAPKGKLIFSSRGYPFLQYLATVKKTQPKDKWPFFLEKMGDLDEVKANYEKGKFIFFPSAHGGDELKDNFFGEAYIPKAYLEKELGKFGLALEHEATDIKLFSQHVFTIIHADEK